MTASTTARRILAVASAIAHGLVMLALSPVLAFGRNITERFVDVDRVLGSFSKLEAKLDRAIEAANARADRFSEQANYYDDLAEAAEDAAERAARVRMRLSRLLD